MKKEAFVQVINEVVSDAAIEITLENLIAPTGRKPDEKILKQSEWYKNMDKQHQELLASIITNSVHEAIFGFFCVLDGVRSISKTGESDVLNLYHKDSKLDDMSGEYLHDIYHSLAKA